MQPSPNHAGRRGRGQRGQILVIMALAIVALIGGVALVIEGGNAYAHQRVAQNAADSVANSGATVLAQELGARGTKTDADVLAAMDAMAAANHLDSYTAYYTTVTGADTATAAQVGGTTIPPDAQGVRVSGNQAFGTTFARAIGMNQFTATADATAVAGALTGGQFLPVVFPVSMADCDKTGGLVDPVPLDAPWRLARGAPPPALPVGQEYIVPLCKTGGGSFMILDLDPGKNCYEEVTNPSSIQFEDFPVHVATDVGDDCAKKIEDAVADSHLQGTVVMVPICDGQCDTDLTGSNATYHIIRIAAFFLDYISYTNSPHNSLCAKTTSPTYGTDLENIVGGNGSSSCVVGWFVRYITSGPVGSGSINNGEAIGVQLIR